MCAATTAARLPVAWQQTPQIVELLAMADPANAGRSSVTLTSMSLTMQGENDFQQVKSDHLRLKPYSQM